MCAYSRRVSTSTCILGTNQEVQSRKPFPFAVASCLSILNFFFKKGLTFLVGKAVQALEAFLNLIFSDYTSSNDNCVSKGRSIKESLNDARFLTL